MTTENKSRFHIHFDGKVISSELEKWAFEKGFWWDNFITGDGAFNYVPDRHLTLKPETPREFSGTCKEILEYLNQHPDRLVGYLECEHIRRRQVILSKEFNPLIKFPFSVKTELLQPGKFRESEIHVSMSKKNSHPELLQKFRDAGFFVAFTKRTNGTNIVFTTQGYAKDLKRVWEMLVAYLQSAGGSVDCHMKEERITKHWLSSPDYPLPPIIREIIIV
jgi:hypothetical protein